MPETKIEKPVLLQAVEVLLSNPKSIRKQALETLEKSRNTLGDNASDVELRAEASRQIIARYSNYTALAGGATAVVSIVPGLGTLVAATGGALSDAAICMKFQLEMTWELATIHGRNIHLDEERNLCYLLAGLGALSEVAKKGGTKLGVAALASLSRPYLRGAASTAVKLIFQRLGFLFARKAFEKAIPFGIGLGISMLANKALTKFVGMEVAAFYLQNGDDGIIDVDYKDVSTELG